MEGDVDTQKASEGYVHVDKLSMNNTYRRIYDHQ